MFLNLEDFIIELNNLKNTGWIKTHRSGSTGIGFTFESLMGIKENNAGLPDFMDYEIKSGRLNSSSMLTLFTLSPKPARSNTYLREKYGYLSPEYEYPKKVLHATLSTQRFTDVGGKHKLKLLVEDDKIFVISEKEKECIFWERETIRKAFDKKIKNKIIYIKADSTGLGSEECFWFKEGYIVSGFDFDSFINLVECGKIFVDLRIGQYKNGKTHDHGTAFRIKASDQIELFKDIKIIL